jgi:hypothetical protein
VEERPQPRNGKEATRPGPSLDWLGSGSRDWPASQSNYTPFRDLILCPSARMSLPRISSARWVVEPRHTS